MKCDNRLPLEYEAKFNSKIDYFKNHPKYEWLRQYANDALNWYANFGYLQIKAEDFMNRIIAKPLDYIQDWLDGKNQLEWSSEEKEEERRGF